MALAAAALVLITALWLAPPGSQRPMAVSPKAPVFRIIEGKAHSVYPYSPNVLTIPARRVVTVVLTDNLGGCGLVTVFPRLAVHGGAARVRVPVGASRAVALRAPAPGRYPFHCAGDMYFGTIVAR